MDGAWDAPGKTRHRRPRRHRGRGQAPAAPRGGGRRPFGSLGSSVSNLMLQPLPETGDGAIAPLRLPAPPLGGRVSLRISESEPGLRFPGNGAGRKSSGPAAEGAIQQPHTCGRRLLPLSGLDGVVQGSLRAAGGVTMETRRISGLLVRSGTQSVTGCRAHA